MQNQELDLTEYSGSLRRAVPRMLVVGVVFAALAVLATFIMKPTWEVEASLLMDNKPQMAPSLEALFDQSANPLTVLKGILRSRTAMERIAAKASVDRKDLEDRMDVKVANDENQLTINVKWKGEGKALEIVQAALDTLDGMKKEIGFSVAARQAKQLEQAIKTKTAQLNRAEQAIQDYQKKMKSLIDPTSASSVLDLFRQEKQTETDLAALKLQIQSARERANQVGQSAVDLPTGLPTASDWQKRLSKASYDLQIARINQSDSSPNVIRLKKELDVTRAQLQKEVLNYVQSVQKNLDVDVAKLEADRIVTEMRLNTLKEMVQNAPKEGRELNTLLREAAIQNQVLTTLRSQYEIKRLDEEGDVSWSVLEKPHLTEDEPINKKFGRNGFLGFLVGVFLVGGFSVFGQRRRSFASGG